MAKRRLRTQKEYAAELGVSAPRITALKKKGKLRMVGRRVDLDTSLQLHQERLAAQQRSPARQVFDHYRAKLMKLEFEKTAGELIEVNTVRQQWSRGVVTIKNAFLGLGRELAPLLVGRGPQEIRATIDRRVFEILRLLAHEKVEVGQALSPPKEAP